MPGPGKQPPQLIILGRCDSYLYGTICAAGTLSACGAMQDAIMERVYETLLSLGYPPAGVDLLRHYRLRIIVLLAILAWLPVIFVVQLVMWTFGA
jgi:hypothetical protein